MGKAAEAYRIPAKIDRRHAADDLGENQQMAFCRAVANDQPLLAGTWNINGGATAGGAIFLAHLGTGINPAPGTAYIDPGQNSGNLRRLAIRADRRNQVLSLGSQQFKAFLAMITTKFIDGHNASRLLVI
jgi:hypothetical protein